MSNKYQIYLISDSTGETLDRIFLALKSGLKTDYNHLVITISKKSFNYL